MSAPRPALVVFVDVNGRNLRAQLRRGTYCCPGGHCPRPAAVWAGATLYCWSSGGAEYAHESALEAGNEGCFSGFLPKPQVMIDDQLVSAWKRRLQVHPNSGVGMSADEYRERLKPAR